MIPRRRHPLKRRFALAALPLGSLLAVVCTNVRAQVRLVPDEREFGLSTQIGLGSPARFVPNSEQAAVGVEASFNRLLVRQNNGVPCGPLARAGVLVQAYSFRNPVVLGHSLGAALFYEPQLLSWGRLAVSGRILAGVSYVSRQYDAETNPTNRAIGTAMNGLIGAGLLARYVVAPGWRVLVGLEGKHLSNAGVRLPNQGLNTPALTVGMTYFTGASGAQLAKRPKCPSGMLGKRWLTRMVMLGSTRVLPATTDRPERGYPIWGLNLVGGYAVWRSHYLSGGVEVLDDRSFREQLRRWHGGYQAHRQVTMLAGYECWMGPFGLTAHMGWNIVRPPTYNPTTYQKYSLLAKSRSGLTGGVAVKAYGDDTKNIQLVLGYSL
ncbi:acyloxyacyl hydrolase [Rudanella paleaurantiibacter]|uniref:Acyloxyacyl hydrolase n=1 Tax=Rudanella paleaurantiibacter TaxID=2614655 RepID=A0A7J5U4J0_9BACT|nr:acyloxyacyl hydrolase [Rudanella paleaurantiibacter]KAB7732641.1 acyloxyacyl hydrolase [Rudanella paleaurantiibacter]